MLQELRFAARKLHKQPGFSLIAVMTLALGIGATAAVFTLIQGVLWTAPPYADPQQLVLVQRSEADNAQDAGSPGWAAAQWTEWRDQASAFDSIAAYFWTFNFLIQDDGSESLEGMGVTSDYFRVTGLQPALGRAFTESDGAPETPPVVILGHELWQRQFNGDRDIVGKTIRISRRETPPTVVGVMPPGVRFMPSPSAAQEPNYDVDALVDFWMPAAPRPDRMKAAFWNVVGRMKPGAQLQQAQEELTVLAARQTQDDPELAGRAPALQALSVEANRDGRRILLPLLGAAALVLLIGCGNAAALLLVRGLQRQQEYAVRSALGVGRAALFRQVAAESLLMALLGGALGVALAFGIVRVFKTIGGHAIPRLDAVAVGWPVLAVGLGAAVVAAVLAGVVPALRASRLDPMHVLKGAGPKSSAGAGERGLLRGVTMAQTALTLVLLVGAGLLIRTMMNFAQVQSGYNADHVLTMSVTSVEGDWADFHHRALERVARLPGVENAAFAWGVPLTGNNWPAGVEIEGQAPAARPSDRIAMPLRSVTPDYFRLLGQTIVQGRDVRTGDNREAPSVAVVNQAFVERYFPDRNPIGRKIWSRGRENDPTEIIGVVSDGRTNDLTKTAEPEIYLSLWQAGAYSKHLVVRTASDPRTVAAAVQRELRDVNPAVAVENVKTLQQIRGESLASRSFAMQLLIGFAAVGSLLTLVGIYGVLSLSIASRGREIAIRSAVGAEARDVLKLVFGEGFRLIAGGVAVGVLAAIALSRVLQALLFEVSPTDPLTLSAVAAAFVAVGLSACWGPARRAVKADPLEALRHD